MDFQPDVVGALRRVKIPSRILEDFCPVAESLEWRLSEQYWRTAGTRGFVEESVPYSATSGGALSQDAAAVLLANCKENPPVGPMVVLELCAGTGLFARLFLDAFHRLCREAGERFDEQLVYYVTDRSPATLAQWKELGVFDGTRAIPACGDAREPLQWETDGGRVELSNIRAVFCNYGLDSLPASILRRGKNGPEELCIRTHLTGDEARLRRLPAPGLDELREKAGRLDAELSTFVSLFEIEAAFLPCERSYTMLDEALQWCGEDPRVILNHGAMDCLRQLATAMDPCGFVLFSDYGVLNSDAPAAHSNAQQFGESQAIGLHFPLMAHYVSTLGAELVEPASREPTNLHSRLLIRGAHSATRTVFAEHFGADNWKAARAQVQAGALDEAKAIYEAALEKHPRDWSLLGEVAEFLIRQASDFNAGLEMARAALALNPWYSTWLWNVYGDAQYGLQMYEEAIAAYKIAEAMSPRDVRTQVNLSYAHAAAGDSESALVAIARGLAGDGSGEYRERLKEKQQQILGTLRALRTDAEQARERRKQRLNCS
jgi:SAM-dependent MidA family methyltransferase